MERMAASFDDFGFRPEIEQAIRDAGYVTPTPIQAQVIPTILEGRDLTGMAETGSGKTAAFLLPIINNLEPGDGDPRALVVAPTRELAIQVGAEAVKLSAHRRLRVATVYGGTGLGEQKNELLAGVDLVAGTPGRLIDFIRQTYLRLSKVRYLVLDEADRMLDMGFIRDIEFIMSRAPASRQTLLFSATLPPEILELAKKFMHEPVRVEVERPTITARNIDQSVIMARTVEEKTRILQKFLRRENPDQALIFVATREMTSDLGHLLQRAGLRAASISSLLSQVNREKVLEGFRQGTTRLLVATDVAGRGLDITGVSHVINFDVPSQPDDYVHRVGRTGRAGRAGRAITLVTPRDRPLLAAVEQRLGVPLRRENAEGGLDTRLETAEEGRPAGGRASRRSGKGGRGRPAVAAGPRRRRGRGGPR
jgi:ATP-dependent RNA helicase DeaD